MATVVKSFSIQGIDAYPVDIEIKIMEGQPMITIIGLGDQAVKEAAERIRSAIDESGYEFPKKKVIISLAPSDKKKCGSHFDLAMAVGVLKQAELIDAKNLLQYGLIGELSLDGRLRPGRGILPMIIAAKKHGYKSVIVPRGNMVEAGLVQGIQILGFETLLDVLHYLEGKKTCESAVLEEEKAFWQENLLDFADVKGQDEVIDAVTLAAAGGHNMLMIGEPGCGKNMIAQRIPTILPQMTEEECLEITKIYSISGLLPNGHALMKQRPFRAPHHNASLNALLGELAEFSRHTLDALRKTVEDKKIVFEKAMEKTIEMKYNIK